jgi:hypothetical protein
MSEERACNSGGVKWDVIASGLDIYFWVAKIELAISISHERNQNVVPRRAKRSWHERKLWGR